MATAHLAVKRDLAFYLDQPWTFVLVPDPDDGGFAAKVDELPGCLSQGETAEEAMANIREALEGWLSVALEDGDEIPTPGEDFSGKFQVRVPKSVHRELVRKAKAEGTSLNLYIASVLARAVGS